VGFFRLVGVDFAVEEFSDRVFLQVFEGEGAEVLDGVGGEVEGDEGFGD